ncbi:Chromatin modification-related protein png2 [Schizosaccharomyces pombe]|uniref:Chromatin modification-related protein png2 n=1 Tax=Schizosaccharomyces pombe (strain 972 / ATCC 24843) TaxID=284812 RepID=ING2_SCHPO|nr:chromatin modification family protein Png2 [Schizosaccharomyces pombe]O74736.1 RecName: Full=Chromatin modification-related protein png2; AltName: Full=ING1 homolog 2 [Schizosaccharomyces pombe 972h-]8I03_H Chain H, Chromatin modification-related protein png2 [Schizosaccharomyces pombe]CAA21250.1 ING family homolog Png2 [Schizosaccharomyces pombe]|eukprot:NP_001342766.1 chromatin modification family protein Png2 [Schizosaccharomyces pombe]
MGTSGIEIFAALNDFTDAIVSVPESVCGKFTSLKEIDAQVRDIRQNVIQEIGVVLKNEKNDELSGEERCERLQKTLKEILPYSDSKICLATDAMNNIKSCIDRLDAGFEYVELEIPQQLRLGYPDDRALMNYHSTVTPQTSERRRETRRHQNNQHSQQYSSQERSSSYNNFEDASSPQSSYHTPTKRRKNAVPRKSSSPPLSSTKHAPQSTERRPVRRSESRLKQTNGEPLVKHDTLDSSDISREGEQLYCYCQQVSYGQMIGCDNENCKREWFHLPCVGLVEPPKGIWYCKECEELAKSSESRQ